MKAFGENLGELAGHDIVLWRMSGAMPRTVVETGGIDAGLRRIRSVFARRTEARSYCRSGQDLDRSTFNDPFPRSPHAPSPGVSAGPR